MKTITVLHCSETLSLSGCCRVMEHLAKGVNPSRFTSLFCAETGDTKYLNYLSAEKIPSYLIKETLPDIPKPFIAVLHRSGNSTFFWEKLIRKLRAAGVSAFIERNIFGYPDLHSGKQLNRICANSLNTLWHHWRQSGKPEIKSYLERHRVLYNAVSFLPTPGELEKLRSEWRKQMNISEDDFVLGIVTRPDPQKIDALILGLVPYLKKTIPNFTLVTRRYPEVLARPLKFMLGSRYHNLPLSSDLETLKATYALMDVYGNFPSIGESFGMAMAEAMRSHKPVIALDLPQENKGNSQRELIENGVTGFLCATPIEIASSLEMLSKDKILCKKMGDAGDKKMMTSPFSLESVIAQFEAEILFAMGEIRGINLEPDQATIQNYLETYPQQLDHGMIVAKKKFFLLVYVVRFVWKIIRKIV